MVQFGLYFVLVFAALLFQAMLVLYTALGFLFAKADVFVKSGLSFFIGLVFAISFSSNIFSLPGGDVFIYLGMTAGAAIGALKHKRRQTMAGAGSSAVYQSLLKDVALLTKLVLYALIGALLNYLVFCTGLLPGKNVF